MSPGGLQTHPTKARGRRHSCPGVGVNEDEANASPEAPAGKWPPRRGSNSHGGGAGIQRPEGGVPAHPATLDSMPAFYPKVHEPRGTHHYPQGIWK